jgi:hypothetical protein
MTTPTTTGHFLRFARALALVGSITALSTQSVGCAASVSPDAGDGAPPDSSAQCVCCPTGDWSGRCAVNPGIAPMVDSGSGAPRPMDASPEPPLDGGGEDRVWDAATRPPPIDSGAMPAYLDPPPGTRWCTAADLSPPRPGGPSCPIAGPLAPPEVDF